MKPITELPPIERDEPMDRSYIPVPGNWEIQTKGRGSSFRILNRNSGRRMLVIDEHVGDAFEAMALDLRASYEELAAGHPIGVDKVMCEDTGDKFLARFPRGWVIEIDDSGVMHVSNPSKELSLTTEELYLDVFIKSFADDVVSEFEVLVANS